MRYTNTGQTMRFKEIVRYLLITATFFFMAACGGSSGGGTPPGGTTEAGPVVSGRALLGVLADSQVDVYDVTDLDTPIHSTRTATDADLALAGRFDIPERLITDTGLYVVAVSGGNDLDTNNDGVADAGPTSNAGTLHLVISGSRMKAGLFHANILTEIIYQKIRYLLLAAYPAETLIEAINNYVCALLMTDVDGDRDMDLDDIFAFDPATDRDRSSRSWGFLSDCIWAVRNNVPLEEGMDTIRENIISMMETPEHATEMEMRDDLVYLVDSKGFSGDGTSTLRIIDYSEPGRPELVSSEDLPGNARAITLSGDYAYIADGYEGLTIVRISSPTIPYVTGTLDLDGATRDVVVSGDTAFVTNYINGSYDQDLIIVDVSNPRSPSVLSTLDLPGTVSRIALYGNTAYITAGSRGLHVVDVSDPAAPTLVTTYEGFVDDVYYADIYNRSLFTMEINSSENRATLRIHSLLSPSSPSRVGLIRFPAIDIQDVFIHGNSLYVCTGSHGIKVLDISTYTSPRMDFTMDTPGGYLNDLFVSGTTAYLADSRLGVYTVDISDPDDPPVYSNLGTRTETSRVDALGNYAYLGEGWGGLEIISIMDPDLPSVVGSISYGYALDFSINGDYAVLNNASGGGDLEIWDISDPRTPAITGTIDTTRYCVATSGNHILVGSITAGLRIYDMSTPASPSLVGEVDTPGDPRAITVYTHYALVADSEEGVQVIDISDPTTPVIVANIPTTLSATHVVMDGSTAWISEQERVVGVSLADPASPAVLERIPVPGTVYRAAASNDSLYVACGAMGIQVIDISDPADIHADCGIFTSHEAMDVSISGDHVFVADYRSGLTVFRAIQ